MDWSRFSNLKPNPAPVTGPPKWKRQGCSAREIISARSETSIMRGRACVDCGRRVRLTLPTRRRNVTRTQAKDVGIRCVDCFQVFCAPCAYEHFGHKPPSWSALG